ncbi:hypothetical protein ACWDV7_33720 [Streptomyces sp. NPDC003362]
MVTVAEEVADGREESGVGALLVLVLVLVLVVVAGGGDLLHPGLRQALAGEHGGQGAPREARVERCVGQGGNVEGIAPGQMVGQGPGGGMSRWLRAASIMTEAGASGGGSCAGRRRPVRARMRAFRSSQVWVMTGAAIAAGLSELSAAGSTQIVAVVGAVAWVLLYRDRLAPGDVLDVMRGQTRK